jgi:hypothetical protein
VATVKNITDDVRSIGDPYAPPVSPGDEVTIADERFVDRAWPKSTWALVEPPKLAGYSDDDTDDAHCFVIPPPEPKWPEEDAVVDGHIEDPGAFTVEQVVEYLATADPHEQARVISAETAGKARKGITEWSAS